MPGDPNNHSSDNDVLCWRFCVSGKVQGVYFRASTRQEALRLGLTGVARNEANGTVTVIARGTIDSLQALHSWLIHGPAMARVDHVSVDVAKPRAYEGFSVA
jgi:acylphosphatase